MQRHVDAFRNAFDIVSEKYAAVFQMATGKAGKGTRGKRAGKIVDLVAKDDGFGIERIETIFPIKESGFANRANDRLRKLHGDRPFVIDDEIIPCEQVRRKREE